MILFSVYGGEVAPLAIETTTGFYNSQFGSVVASGVNPAYSLLSGAACGQLGDHWHR